MRLSDIHPEARSVWLVQTGFIIVMCSVCALFSLVFRHFSTYFHLFFC
jgi:hypothetical protein